MSTILSNEEKKQVIESLQLDASENNFLLQSQKYNTSIRNLQRWFNQGYVRKSGCGRKRVNPQAVTDLESWIMSETKIQQKKLTRQQIKVKALEMFNNNTFKASKMWMDNFLQKFDIKIKVLTILQNNGCLSKLQQATFNQQIRQKKEKETESQETKKNVKKQTTLVKQEQIATDLVEKQEFKGKTEVSEFLYLDENLFFDSQSTKILSKQKLNFGIKNMRKKISTQDMIDLLYSYKVILIFLFYILIFSFFHYNYNQITMFYLNQTQKKEINKIDISFILFKIFKNKE